VPAKIQKKKKNSEKDGPPSSMVLLVFLENEKLFDQFGNLLNWP